ncbi:MAG: S8 family serine peptidase [Verrucomicrobiota bacterium]
MIRRFPNCNLLPAFILICASSQAAGLDDIGVTLLRAMTTNLNGTDIRIAQVEGTSGAGHTDFEVNPSTDRVQQPINLFTYYSRLGSTNGFPNAVGTESGHANIMGGILYGLTNGIATNVAHIDNFNADYFIQSYYDASSNLVVVLPPTNMNDLVINQSFTFGNLSASIQQIVDSAYDDCAVSNNAFFVSAACNYSIWRWVCAPGTAYNCISVAAYGGDSSIGPTTDNGRCKPDITAPAYSTSGSTPQVSGAAVLLMQAARRGDGGSDTNAAADLRTIKALLLNGAVKPANWTNSSASPLDLRYGAGVVNAFNAYEQLAGGKQVFCASNSFASGAAHPPPADTNTVAATSGWSRESISSSATEDAVHHYFFNVSKGMATITLVWNRELGQTNINDLDLFLFDAANSNLVAGSTSRVDNVEHLFLPQLPAGHYDLQVLKNGGTNAVSDGETYALAFAFVSPEPNLTKSGTNLSLTWPVYPAGFRAEATTNLVSPIWSTSNLSVPFITNSMNSLILKTTNTFQFFRLRSPDF